MWLVYVKKGRKAQLKVEKLVINAVTTCDVGAGIAAQGLFGPLIKLPLVPVASVALPNGDVSFNPLSAHCCSFGRIKNSSIQCYSENSFMSKCMAVTSACMQVLVWSGDAVDTFNPENRTSGVTFYAVYDSVKGSVGALQSVDLNHDMFCPGIAIRPNGNVVVVAGSAHGDGASATSQWTGNSWVSLPQLNTARGYNTAVTMTNGQVCIFFCSA